MGILLRIILLGLGALYVIGSSGFTWMKVLEHSHEAQAAVALAVLILVFAPGLIFKVVWWVISTILKIVGLIFFGITDRVVNLFFPKREVPADEFYNSQAWRHLRYKVLATYGARCMLCNKEEGPIHVDHIKPRSKYPDLAYEFTNLQVLCEDCNMGKSNHFEDDFRITRWDG